MEATVGLLVRDERRHEFATRETIGRHNTLTVGIPGNADFWEDYVRALMAGTNYSLVNLGSCERFFDRTHGEIDVVLGWIK